ncbi:MAG: glycosyltransferase family 4 protein [Conexibacter sp.]
MPDRRLRIAHVTATFPPYLAGTGNLVFELTDALAARGHDVEVFTAPASADAGPPPATRATVHRIPPLLAYGNAPLIPHLATLRGFDAIHLHYPFIFGAELLLAGRVATRRSRRPPLVATWHNALAAGGPRGALFAAYERSVGPLLARTVARAGVVTRAHGDSVPYLRALAARRPERVVELPNGVDVAAFRPGEDDGGLRARIGADADDVLVAFVAALDAAHWFKGLEVVLAALARARSPRLQLVVAGAGELRGPLEAEAARLGVAERVAFLGRVAHDRLPATLRGCDALVSASTAVESFGMTLIEAMASGLPVITSDLPGPASLVQEDATGWIVPSGDAAALATRLDRLAALGCDGRAAIGASGRERAERLWAWPHVAARHEALYGELVRG